MRRSEGYKLLILSLIIGVCFSFRCSFINAAELEQCDYTEEYLNWLKLDESERNNIAMPTMCKMDADTILLNEILLESEVEDSFPSTYSITDYYDKVKDQKRTESCWAYSAISVVESYFAKNSYSYVELAPLHMEYATASNFLDESNPFAEKFYEEEQVSGRPLNSGGNFSFASAYFTSGRGPVKLEDFNHSNESLPEEINLSDIDVPTYADINDTLYVDYFKDCSQASATIKNHLMKYGAVTASIRFDGANYLNTTNNAYYYNGDEAANHSITIVGWNDDYSKDNFGTLDNQVVPQNNGAWLVLNSYGTTFGDDGYFYISYEDTEVCNNIGGIRSADTEFTDNQYIYDYITPVLIYQGQNSVGYAANTFELKGTQELLKEVRVNTRGTTTVTAYIIEGDQPLNINSATYLAEGTVTGGGYTTLKLEEPYVLNSDKFTIIVKYNSAGEQLQMPFVSTEKKADGLSYYSAGGTYFINVSQQGQYASIKAYTDDYDYTITPVKENLDEYKYNNREGGVIVADFTTVNIPNDEELEAKIFNSGEEDVSDLFTVTISSVLDNSATVKIIIPDDESVPVGTYTLRVKYLEKSVDLNFDVLLYKDINVELEDTLPDIMYNNESHSINYKVVTTNVDDDETFTVELKDPNGEPVEEFTESELKIKDNQAIVNISILENATPGVYTLTVKMGEMKATTSFTITKYIPLVINVDKDFFVLSNGETAQLNPIINENATNKEFSYVAVDEEIASVTPEGLITAVQSGDATIKIVAAESEDNYKEIKVKVINASITIDTPTITSNASFNEEKLYTTLGGSIQFNIESQEVTEIEVKVLNSKLQETSGFNISGDDNTKTITYDESVKNGTYTIEVTGLNKDSDTVYKKVTDTYEFTIEKYIPVTEIAVSDITIYNNVGVYILDYSIIPEKATFKDIEVTNTLGLDSQTLVTNLDNVISITPDVNTEENFTITIKAKDGSNVSKTINVTTKKVEPVVVEEKEESHTLFAGISNTILYNVKTNEIEDGTNITVKVQDELGSDCEDIRAEVTTLTDNEAVVTITVPESRAAGNYTLIVTVEGQSEVTKTFKLNDYVKLNSIKFDKDKYIVAKGDTLQLNPIIPEGTFIDQIEWEVEEGSIASISSDGIVKGILPGTVTIKGTSKDIPEPNAGNVQLFSDAITDGNTETLDDRFVIKSGTVKYYDVDNGKGRNQAGNRIGLKINAPAELVYDDYKYARITRTTNFKDGSSINKYMYFDNVKDDERYFESWPLVNKDVKSVVIEIQWTSFFTQTITIELEDGVQFENEELSPDIPRESENEGFPDNLISPNNYEVEIQVQVIDTTVSVGEVQIESNATFDSDNLYEILKGGMNIPLTLTDYNKIDVKVYNEFDELVSGFTTNTEDPENINITYDETVLAGSYYALITASYEEDGKVLDSAEAKYEFEIKEYIPITSIDASDITMYSIETKDLEYIINPNNATYKKIDIIVESSDVLDVIEGVITPKKDGRTKITLKALDDSNVTKDIYVDVLKAPISIEIVPKDIPLEIYNSKDIDLNFDINTVNVKDGVTPVVSISRDGEDVDSISKEINPIAENKTSLVVKMTKGITAGTYTVKVVIDDKEETYTFIVKNYVPLGISIDSEYVVPLTDGKLQLMYTIDPDATSSGVEWSSSSDDIAEVSSSGLITFKTSGTVIITGKAIGFPEDSVQTTIKIVDSKVTIDEESVVKESITPFSNDILYTYFGGNLNFDVNVSDVNNIKVSILDSEDQEVLDGFTVTNDPISGDGDYNIRVEYEKTVQSGTYKVKVEVSYLDDDNVIAQATDTYEFEIIEFVPVTEIQKDTITMEIGEIDFLEALVEDVVILPDGATYKELDYEFDLNCEGCDTNSVSINTISNRKSVTAVSPGKVKLKITAKDGYLDEEGNKVSITVDLVVLEEDIFKGTDYVAEDIEGEDGSVKSYVYLNIEQTGIEDFINALNINPGAQASISTRDGEAKETGYVATGDKLHYTSSVTDKEYIIILRGDVSGDGLILANDYVLIRNHIMRIRYITDEYLIAADKSEDDSVLANDYVLIRNIIMGRSS